MLLVSVTYLLSAIVLYWGWKFGGRPERFAALAILAWIALDPAQRIIFGSPRFGRLDWVLFAFDSALAFALIVIALHANRIWPIFGAGFSLIPVIGHIAVLLDTEPVQQAYWAINQIPFLLVLLSLMLGASANRQRMRSGRICYDWSP